MNTNIVYNSIFPLKKNTLPKLLERAKDQLSLRLFNSSWTKYYYYFFLWCYFSLHLSFMSGCLGNIKWDSFSGFNRPCFLLQLDFSGMLHVYWRFFPYLGSLSFFNSHPSNRVSYSYTLRASDRVLFLPSARPRVNVVVHGRALVNSFPILLCVSILMRWPVFELATGFDLAVRPSERT